MTGEVGAKGDTGKKGDTGECTLTATQPLNDVFRQANRDPKAFLDRPELPAREAKQEPLGPQVLYWIYDL